MRKLLMIRKRKLQVKSSLILAIWLKKKKYRRVAYPNLIGLNSRETDLLMICNSILQNTDTISGPVGMSTCYYYQKSKSPIKNQ